MNNSYTGPFIDLAKYGAVTAAIVGGLVTTATLAASQNIKAPSNVPLKSISALAVSPTSATTRSNAASAARHLLGPPIIRPTR